MERKDFLKSIVAATVAAGVDMAGVKSVIAGESAIASSQKDKLVAVMGGEPVAMFEKMMAEMGGISQFVKKGDKVVIKPNIGWAKAPEMAANTNPDLVAALVKQCLGAGASQVLVFDNTCNEWKSCYQLSGIKAAVESAGGQMVPGNTESYYTQVSLPNGVIMKQAKIHKVLQECDVWFNMPILKNHGGAKMTVSMKNYMGIVWDRGYMHDKGLQQCIADLNTYAKKPALHIVDAYRIMKQNGPQGKSIDDVVVTKGLFASPDPIALDTAAVKFFNQVKEMDVADVTHIALGEKHNLGTSNMANLDVRRIKL